MDTAVLLKIDVFLLEAFLIAVSWRITQSPGNYPLTQRNKNVWHYKTVKIASSVTVSGSAFSFVDPYPHCLLLPFPFCIWYLFHRGLHTVIPRYFLNERLLTIQETRWVGQRSVISISISIVTFILLSLRKELSTVMPSARRMIA